VESAVDDVVDVLRESFDLVYTGVGARCWLPSAQRWAAAVGRLLGPGGRLYLRDFHPILHALDDERDDQLLVVEHPYFETPEPNRWESTVSYTASKEAVAQPVTYEWNHGLGEVVQAVLDAGLRLIRLEEHREIESASFFAWMVPAGGGRRRLGTRPERLPLMFTLEAVKA